jgi:hypothetical protein
MLITPIPGQRLQPLLKELTDSKELSMIPSSSLVSSCRNTAINGFLDHFGVLRANVIR